MQLTRRALSIQSRLQGCRPNRRPDRRACRRHTGCRRLSTPYQLHCGEQLANRPANLTHLRNPMPAPERAAASHAPPTMTAIVRFRRTRHGRAGRRTHELCWTLSCTYPMPGRPHLRDLRPRPSRSLSFRPWDRLLSRRTRRETPRPPCTPSWQPRYSRRERCGASVAARAHGPITRFVQCRLVDGVADHKAIPGNVRRDTNRQHALSLRRLKPCQQPTQQRHYANTLHSTRDRLHHSTPHDGSNFQSCHACDGPLNP